MSYCSWEDPSAQGQSQTLLGLCSISSPDLSPLRCGASHSSEPQTCRSRPASIQLLRATTQYHHWSMAISTSKQANHKIKAAPASTPRLVPDTPSMPAQDRRDQLCHPTHYSPPRRSCSCEAGQTRQHQQRKLTCSPTRAPHVFHRSGERGLHARRAEWH